MRATCKISDAYRLPTPASRRWSSSATFTARGLPPKMVRRSAADTASAIQGTRQRLPHHADLREINFGTWELRPFAEIEAEDPELCFAYWDNPGEARPPNGESWNEVRARVDRVVDTLIAAHTGCDLVLVAHFGVILTQVQRALDVDAQHAFGHRIDNLSVTEITRHNDGWTVGRINHRP